ncbi:unnamed protein product [Closterium sp. NIES-53]
MGDNEKVVAEIEDLLADGAIVIKREIEGDIVQQGADDNVAAEKGGAENENEEMGKGKRVKKPNPKYAQMLLTCCKDIHTHLLLPTMATALLSKGKVESYKLPTEPLTIEEALSGPNKEEWRAAIQEELDTLAERGTWELVNMPEGRKPVGVRWIFKIKTGDMDQLERFKAQLVAKGYTQEEGEDFDQIYAPMSKLTTARTMLKVWKKVEEVCTHLAAVFQVKKIPRTTLFLGMNLERNREEKKLLLYQKKYFQRLRERFGGQCKTKPVTTPLSSLANKEVDVGAEIEAWGSKERALKAYQSMVGSVMYPVSCTRVDVAHAASFLGQKVLQPEGRKWKEMERTITYLLQRDDEGLLFEGGEESLELVGYADASHGSDKKDGRGAYGYVYLLGGTAIMWQAKKLTDVALSGAESEYMALFYACQEGVWLRRLLQEMGVKVEGPTTIKSDSKSAIDLARNDTWHGRTKHMNVQYHWVREQLQKKAFTFVHMRTQEQPADFLTKVLPKANFEFC